MTLLYYISARRRGMKKKDYYSSLWEVFLTSTDIHDPFSRRGLSNIWDDIKNEWWNIRYPIPFISKEEDYNNRVNKHTIKNAQI